METYDLCIVGAGMIGSAAARHASSVPGLRMCIIGPDEPQEKRTSADDRDVFGAHYDEGRITRRTDSDPVWGLLAQRSIARYRELERLSGVKFYEEVGYLLTGERDGEMMNNLKKNARIHNCSVQNFDHGTLLQRYPYLNMPCTDEFLLEYQNAGYISARNMVQAQLKVAVKNGCHVIRDIARSVRRRVGRTNEYVMEIVCASGQKIFAKKVLLAAGAFANFNNILGADVELDISLCPITVARVEVSASDAKKIRDMPSSFYRGKGADNWTKEFPRDSGGIIMYYMLPAVQYPDGKYYLKLGHCHETTLKRLTTAEEVKRWFCSYGNPDHVKSSADLICGIVKGIKPLSVRGDSCVVVETPTERPYIDMLHSQLGIVAGGNGHAAKSSDEIGRMAAMMVVKDTWESDIPRDVFKVRLKGFKSKL